MLCCIVLCNTALGSGKVGSLGLDVLESWALKVRTAFGWQLWDRGNWTGLDSWPLKVRTAFGWQFLDRGKWI